MNTLNPSAFLGLQGKTLSNETVSFSELLTQPLNVLHFQDSCGSGRTCRIVTKSIEDHLSELTKYASVTIIFADDAFDRETPPTSSIQRAGLSKNILGELGLLDEDGYVKRTTLIVSNEGDILRELPVLDEGELELHITQSVLPELRKLSDGLKKM